MRQSALSGRSGEAGSYRNGIISRSANGPDTVFSHQNANAPEARYAEGDLCGYSAAPRTAWRRPRKGRPINKLMRLAAAVAIYVGPVICH